MKICKDCAHYIKPIDTKTGEAPECRKTEQIDPVDGEKLYFTCRYARQLTTTPLTLKKCEPEGRWFEPKAI